MLLERLFRTRPAVTAGRALYDRVVSQARQPGLYGDLAVPDTVEGRFEAYSLHVVLLLHRLRTGDAEGRADAREVSQALFDTYVKALDHALREMGVGDLSVGKKMRRLGEAFYGRCKSYEAAFAALPDEGPLTALLGRTAYAGVEAPPVAGLAAYVLAQRASLAAQPLAALVGGEVAWRTP